MTSPQSHNTLDETIVEILPDLTMEHEEVKQEENEDGGEKNEIEIKMPFYPSGEARRRTTARMRTPQVRTVFTFSLDSQTNKRARTSSPEIQEEVPSLHETGESSRVPPPLGDEMAPPLDDDMTPPLEDEMAPPLGDDIAPPPGGDMTPPLDIGVIEDSIRYMEAIEEGNRLEGRVKMLEAKILENDTTIIHFYESLSLAHEHIAMQQDRITALEVGMEEARQQQVLAEWRTNSLSQQVMLADVRANMAENRVIGAEARLGEMEQKVGNLELQVHYLTEALSTRLGQP